MSEVDQGTIAAPSRENRVDAAQRSIREMIVTLVLKPGEKISEEDIADRLGMSRTPIREALIRLNGEHLIEMAPARGARVSPLTSREALETYDLLTHLESGAAEMLALRGPTDSQTEILEGAMQEMERCTDDGDLSAWARADSLFHRSVVEFCCNELLRSVALNYLNHADRIRNYLMPHRANPSSSNADHRRIARAFQDRDAHTAREMMRAHRVYHRRRILAELRRLQDGADGERTS